MKLGELNRQVQKPHSEVHVLPKFKTEELEVEYEDQEPPARKRRNKKRSRFEDPDF